MSLSRLLFLIVCAAIIWATMWDSLWGHSDSRITSRFYATLGSITGGGKSSTWQGAAQVPLSEVPLALQQATIAVEDARFHQHHGVETETMEVGLFSKLQDPYFVEARGTITQQLARNTFFSPDKTVTRKIGEIVLATGMEVYYSKAEILEMYLNRSYYGAGTYGVAAAAEVYFGKRVKSLNLAESAMLAGLPQGPAVYSPYVNFNSAKKRQAAILDLMVQQGFITASAAEKAKKEPISLAR